MAALSVEQMWQALAAVDHGPFGARIHYEARVGSTNDIARRLADDQAPTGTLVISDEQTAGRGRMGRRWQAAFGLNLLMSVIFRPTIAPVQVNRLVMVCGAAIAEACEAQSGVQVAIKWPNDLLIGGKKFSGILPESTIIGDELRWVIVGMGINVNQVFTDNDPLSETAASLRMATGHGLDRLALLAAIMARLNHWYDDLDSPALLDMWRRRCTMLGQWVSIKAGQQIVEGRAADLDDVGALLVVDDEGEHHRIAAGESSVIRSAT